MQEIKQIGVNSGLMGGEVVEKDSKLILINCETGLPCTLLSKSGHCNAIPEGVDVKGRPLNCGRAAKLRLIPEES